MDSGQATPRWQAAERLLAEFEADLDRTAQMSAALARLQLLEPFALQLIGAKAEKGISEVKMTGMYRVSEAKLRDLKPASHKMLVTKGFMSLLYAHLHSLENFSRLAARRQEGGKGSPASRP